VHEIRKKDERKPRLKKRISRKTIAGKYHQQLAGEVEKTARNVWEIKNQLCCKLLKMS
jgi:hypothetical protein